MVTRRAVDGHGAGHLGAQFQTTQVHRRQDIFLLAVAEQGVGAAQGTGRPTDEHLLGNDAAVHQVDDGLAVHLQHVAAQQGARHVLHHLAGTDHLHTGGVGGARDPVLALQLAALKHEVGLGQDLVEADDVGRHPRHTDAGGGGQHVIPRLDDVAADGQADALGHVGGFVLGFVGQHHGETVRAHAAHQIVRAHDLLDATAGGHQHQIPHAVAQGGVDAHEIVQINQQDLQLVLLGTHLVDALQGGALHALAVEQIGQGIRVPHPVHLGAGASQIPFQIILAPTVVENTVPERSVGLRKIQPIAAARIPEQGATGLIAPVHQGQDRDFRIGGAEFAHGLELTHVRGFGADQDQISIADQKIIEAVHEVGVMRQAVSRIAQGVQELTHKCRHFRIFMHDKKTADC